MKWIPFLLVLSSFSCNQEDEKLSAAEIAQIKREIIKRSEKHVSDLKNLDYKPVMTFYANTQDFIVFGDGYYWGDYLTLVLFGICETCVVTAFQSPLIFCIPYVKHPELRTVSSFDSICS